MFDLDAGKLLIIAIVALVVIPPKDLPSVMRQVGQVIGKMRRMAAEFQSQFMDAVREADLDDIRDDVRKLSDDAKRQFDFDPVAAIRDELRGALGEGPVLTNTVATEPSGTQNATAKESIESPPLVTEAKPREAPATEAVAPSTAPAQSDDAPAVIPPMTVEAVTAEPSVSQPGEPADPAQQADARRS